MRITLKACLVTIIALVVALSTTTVAYAREIVDDPDGTSQSAGSDEILVKFKPGVNASDEGQIHRLIGGSVKETIPEIGVQVVTVPAGQAIEKVKAYKSRGEVSYAESNSLVGVVGAPDDAYWSNQWNMSKVHAPEAWDLTRGSKNINIAIVDTGIDSSHPDLAAKISKTINFTTSPNAGDNYGHGTHVAGIAAAATNNEAGVAGLGYDSSLFNVKVLGDNGFGYNSWVAYGIVWAVDNGAQVVNLSLGDTASSSAMEDAVNYAWSKGVVVVAAAGNNYSSSPFYPAYCANSIAVAATDASDNLPAWSDFGDWVDVSAPGVSIYSTVRGGAYGYMSGTSMASPHVAGLAALLFSVVSDTDGDGYVNDEVRDRLESTADSIGSAGAGKGRINAFNAINGLQPPATGGVSGTVTNYANGSPVPGATVAGAGISVVTDSSGHFLVSGISTGTYSFMASAAGYNSSSLSVTAVAGETAAANFALNSPALSDMWVAKINFTVKGKTLIVSPAIMTNQGAVSGVRVVFDTMLGGQDWSCQGVTDATGSTSFVLNQPTSGTYAATVTGLSAGNYVWNTGKGIISASYTLSANGKSAKR